MMSSAWDMIHVRDVIHNENSLRDRYSQAIELNRRVCYNEINHIKGIS